MLDAGTDRFGAGPSHDGPTALREVLLVGDHVASHVGELSILRRVVNG